MQDFRQLEIWRISRMLVLQTYKATNTFPRESKRALKEQLRQRAVTLLFQIARGLEADSFKSDPIALNHAAASVEILQRELKTAWDKGYLNTLARDELLSSIQRVQGLLAEEQELRVRVRVGLRLWISKKEKER